LIEFDTELSPLLKEKKGKEVTMTWHLYDSYDGNDTFWTDSNGLEMQERHTVRFSKSNISANFYPVTSAIATRSVPTAGTNESSQPMLQVTVMTERSTGGAADLTERATIELIHERSSRNMSTLEEPGNSTKAPNKSKYWMQILEVNKGKSLQRMKQLQVNNPVQYFYAFDYKEPDTLKSDNSTAFYIEPKFDTFNYQTFPLGKGKILVRVENLADHFDKKNNNMSVQYLHMNRFIRELYMEANPDAAEMANFTAKELTLSGTQNMTDLEDYRLNNTWDAIEDAKPAANKTREGPDDEPEVRVTDPSLNGTIMVNKTKSAIGKNDTSKSANKSMNALSKNDTADNTNATALSVKREFNVSLAQMADMNVTLDDTSKNVSINTTWQYWNNSTLGNSSLNSSSLESNGSTDATDSENFKDVNNSTQNETDLQKPRDNTCQLKGVALEPQRIRTFIVDFRVTPVVVEEKVEKSIGGKLKQRIGK